jgi:rSAM/selenodomain-associated transferase 2
MNVSIIIPTLNEEAALPAVLENVAAVAPGCEVIVVDGGSTDWTVEIARAYGRRIRVIVSERGRGIQMNAGASASTGDVLLFLHADTTLPAQAVRLIGDALKDPRVIGGNFQIQFEPRTRTADLFSWLYNVRSRARIFYGDSVIFVRRATFEKLGGYRFERIMEDIDFVRRLRRLARSEGRRLAVISDAPVRSSARRFGSAGAGIRMLLLWSLLHVMLFFGAGQEALERRYRQVR